NRARSTCPRQERRAWSRPRRRGSSIPSGAFAPADWRRSCVGSRKRTPDGGAIDESGLRADRCAEAENDQGTRESAAGKGQRLGHLGQSQVYANLAGSNERPIATQPSRQSSGVEERKSKDAARRPPGLAAGEPDP